MCDSIRPNEHPAMQTDNIVFRPATRDDVPPVVKLLATDKLGAKREIFSNPLPESYYHTFEAIERDPNNELIVTEVSGSVIGVLQITYLPGMTYRGGWRCLIEGVRIADEFQSKGIGRRLFEWAIERARQKGCHIVQLTSDKTRADAIRFYEKLGFVASHEGMKLRLVLPEAKS